MIDQFENSIDALPRKDRTGLCGAYVIEHVNSGMLYVGSSGNLAKRKIDHKYELKKGTHSNPRLQILFNENAALKWRFWITETREEAYDTEHKILMHLQQEQKHLNIAVDVRNSGIGHVNPDGWEEMISELNKGNKYAIGRTASIVQRAKASERMQAHNANPEFAAKKAAASSARFKGVAQTPEVIAARVAGMLKSDKYAKRNKRVSVDGEIFPSAASVARAKEMSKSTVKYRINSPEQEWKDWFYLSEVKGESIDEVRAE